MKFLPKSTCEALVKMGCKSESEFFYPIEEVNNSSLCVRHSTQHQYFKIPFGPPAFTPCDFLADTDQARENCRKLWPQKRMVNVPCPGGRIGCEEEEWDKYRHALLDVKDQVMFLVKAVEEKQK